MPIEKSNDEISNDEAIVIRGARVHNLKNIDCVIPRDKLVVITGPSGSGKSSLAFDTIYAEGQRRYVESLSAYARQFLEQLSKPDAESISGLSPTISIEQRTSSYNPRSTVGTVTEIYDHLRLLYSRVGKPYCYQCGKGIESQSPQQITDQILAYNDGSKVAILAPIVRNRKGEYQKELASLRLRGFVRVKIDGAIFDLSDEIKIDKNKKHDLSVYVDRIVVKGDRGNLSTRVSEAVELALKLGDGQIIVEAQHLELPPQEILMSERFACVGCGVSYPSPEPRTFSFNSPVGACLLCNGLGLNVAAENRLNEADDSKDPPLYKIEITPDHYPCPTCHGARLRVESLSFKFENKSIYELCSMSIGSLLALFRGLTLSARNTLIAEKIIKEIIERLSFLNEVGVGYLSLSRSAQTLSGGESQRIRLATQIGSSLVGVIYVLDEPSIGLHQKDNDKLIATLIALKDLGNTVIVVEHDRDTMEKADYILDLGPGAGALGGEVIAAGTYSQLLKHKKSLTGKYLRGELLIPVPKQRRRGNGSLTITGAGLNNLKNLTLEIPTGTLTCVTGVSGSGKSSLILDTLYPALMKHLYKVTIGDLKTKSFNGFDRIDKVIDIDQSPIGKTPRSNPATYTGLFSLIRDLFTQLPESLVRGYSAGRFSFNVKGGRCETCSGDGMTKVEMHFMPDVFVLCESCQGRRYNRETLDIRYKGKSIAEVLDMTARDALIFFEAVPTLKMKLKVINDVGLGYIKLGQSATTLSGGEAQRIKLSKELSRRGTGSTVYILDEPSTGLHFDDILKLIDIFHSLVDQGNTVIVIEHNLDIIKVADHIIDLGPGGGTAGGEIMAQGTPEEVIKVSKSATGRYLKPYLERFQKV